MFTKTPKSFNAEKYYMDDFRPCGDGVYCYMKNLNIFPSNHILRWENKCR